MPRVYLDRINGSPLFSIEKVVGKAMTNDRLDVMLVQYFLKVILHSNKIFLAGNTRFTPPPGSELQITGIWDEASARYLTRWEELRYEARAYWGHGAAPATQYPGTVVPYIQGGTKLIAMQEMCRIFYGDEAYNKLQMPNAELPVQVWRELFWDPIYGPHRTE